MRISLLVHTNCPNSNLKNLYSRIHLSKLGELTLSNPIDDEHIEDSEKFVEASGSVWEKYQEWQKELATESVFDNKTRELIMLSAAAAAQCPYCVHTHGQKAAKHGASKEEIAHVVHLASEVKAGASMAYGLEALEHVD